MAKANLLSRLEKAKSIRSRQVFCPVANLRAIVSPLTVNDDLSLKSMVSSPDLYDKDLAILLYNHTEFPDIQGEKPNFDQFIETISDFDKKSILWGIYDATYRTLGKTNITCPKCKNKWETEIFSKDLLNEDTIKGQWDKEEPFNDYYIKMDIPIGLEDLLKFTFNISVPSIKKHLDVLKLINVDEMKDNFNRFNSILSKPEELCLITKSISIYGETEDEPEETIINTFEIHSIIKNYITLDVVNDVIDLFDKEFSIYNPIFKKELNCKSCGHVFSFPVDIEVALFRSFLRL
jgi:hypothetical protein